MNGLTKMWVFAQQVTNMKRYRRSLLVSIRASTWVWCGECLKSSCICVHNWITVVDNYMYIDFIASTYYIHSHNLCLYQFSLLALYNACTVIDIHTHTHLHTRTHARIHTHIMHCAHIIYKCCVACVKQSIQAEQLPYNHCEELQQLQFKITEEVCISYIVFITLWYNINYSICVLFISDTMKLLLYCYHYMMNKLKAWARHMKSEYSYERF